jgi:hypothetical protein
MKRIDREPLSWVFGMVEALAGLVVTLHGLSLGDIQLAAIGGVLSVVSFIYLDGPPEALK